MTKRSINENEFFGAPAGTNGTVNYQTPLNTHSSPDVSQNPDHFAASSRNQVPNQMTPVDSGSLERNLDNIYAKRDVPSPDEVATGLKYELTHMVKKDKGRAKEIVLMNLRKDPHYYGKLNHLNIDDKAMQVEQIFKGLAAARGRKFAVNKGIAQIINQMWDQKKQRKT